ncbi:UDP-3-O-(3-hydroxymyristoyl)glucosamine N-acyltransferase [Planctomycetota bacterium]
MPDITLQKLADLIKATVVPESAPDDFLITGVSTLDAATASDVAFVMSVHHLTAARRSQAGAMIVFKAIDDFDTPQLVVKNVDVALITVLKYYMPPLTPPSVGVHASAVIGENAQIGENVHVGPHVSIDSDVSIGDHVVISAGCHIGQGSRIGQHTRLDHNVVIYHGCTIGDHVVILANSTVGSTGFGYVHVDGAAQLVPHNGGVIIEDFVEIGANCCIDRAKFTNTIVGAGTKMDNMVQIGHNVVLGRGCMLSAQSGIAGSTTLGNGVVMAGQAGVADNLNVADGTLVGAKAGVMKSTEPGQKLVWAPAMERNKALRILSEMYRLPETMKRLKKVEERFEKFDATENDQG